MAKLPGLDNTISRIKNSGKDIHKQAKTVTKSLSSGVYKAMTNANVKRNVQRPKAGKALSAKKGADFYESSAQLPLFMFQRGRPVYIGQTAEDFLQEQKFNKIKAVDTSKPLTKRGKYRTKSVSRYKVVGYKSRPAIQPQAHEIFRKPGADKPKSWKAPGIANMYLRKRWLTKNINDTAVDVTIAPANQIPAFADNKTFLRLLEHGGTTQGGARLKGYMVYFGKTNSSGQTEVQFSPMLRPKKTVSVKGYGFVQKTTDRIKKTIQTRNIQNISASDWREIGSD